MFSMAFISFITAAISAATGMGGGVIFLIGLNLFLPLSKVIPIHGLIQLKNNLVRVLYLRKYLLKRICLNYTVGCFTGVLTVTFFLKSLDSKVIPYALILLLVIYSLFKPKKMPELKLPSWGFIFLGFFTGILGILVGAVDPILAPFFLRDDLSRYEIIANKSFFQMFIHLAKIPVFLYLGFDYVEYWFLILILFITAILGTFTGLKILDRISQVVFQKFFKIILFAVSLKVAYTLYTLI